MKNQETLEDYLKVIDPFEISNVAGEEKNRPVIVELSERLARGWQSVLPAKNN